MYMYIYNIQSSTIEKYSSRQQNIQLIKKEILEIFNDLDFTYTHDKLKLMIIS